MSSPCHRPLPASDDPDGDGARELPGRGIRDVAPNLPFLARESSLGEEDDLGRVTQDRCCHTALCPPRPAQPGPHAPCTLPGLVLILKPSLSSCCGHPRGREEHRGTSAAPAISPQPKEAAVATSRLVFAAPSHRPEQPHLSIPAPRGPASRHPPGTSCHHPGTLPSCVVPPTHHLSWYPSVACPGTLCHPSRNLPPPMPKCSVTHPSTLCHPSWYLPPPIPALSCCTGDCHPMSPLMGSTLGVHPPHHSPGHPWGTGPWHSLALR